MSVSFAYSLCAHFKDDVSVVYTHSAVGQLTLVSIFATKTIMIYRTVCTLTGCRQLPCMQIVRKVRNATKMVWYML